MNSLARLFMLICAFMWMAQAPSALANIPDKISEEFIYLEKQKVTLNKKGIPIGDYIDFAEDEQGTWLAQEIFDGKYQHLFVPNTSAFASFGFTESVFWLGFEIDFSASQYADELFLVLNAPTLDYLTLYVQDGRGDISQKNTGYRFPASSRDVEHHSYVFKLDHTLDSPQKYLLRVQSTTSLVMDLTLWKPSAFYKQDYFNTILIGAYYGVLLVMFFYNLFIFISIRDISYLYYILFIAAYGIMQFTLDGMLGHLVWGEVVTFRGIDLVIVAAISGICAIAFSISFLQTKTTLPRLHQVLVATMVLEVVLIVLSLLSGVMLVKYVVYLSLWITLLLIVVGIFAFRAGQHGAKYFLLAWTFLLMGSASYLLNILNVFSSIFFMTYGMKMGSAVEIVLLSLGLADRMNEVRRSREQLLLERSEFETRTHLLASVDTRTAMPNRAQLQQQLARYSIDPRHFSLILMKVMRFKQINNTLGHENGDELLKLLALKIDSVFSSKRDMALSVGNNAEGIPSNIAVVDSLTFAAIIKAHESRAVNDFAVQIREEISGTIEFKNVLIDLEIVMGISSHDHTFVKSPEKMVHEAQVGLAAATRLEQRIALYTPLIDPYSEKQLSLMGYLRKAVSDESLNLYYQVQVDIKTQRLAGFEALLRWKDLTGQYVSPMSFIPLAESCGVIRPLTRWVIRQALSTLAELQKHRPDIYISVNLSVSNLREDDLVQYIRHQIKEFSVNPACIKFEITESSMIENEELALNRLLQLRRLGCQISIDDYGSGYASLGYLKQLPISEVKIDRSFIMGLNENQDDQVIVKATIKMCHDLGLMVVAEGVETEETLELLKSFDCDVAQGYLLGRPAPMADPENQKWLQTL